MHFKTMLSTAYPGKFTYNARPMPEPCSMFKSNSQYRKTSQSPGNRTNQNNIYAQTTRQMDVTRSFNPAKSIAHYKQNVSQSLMCTRLYPRGTSLQVNHVDKSTLSKKNITSPDNLDCSAKCYNKQSNNTVCNRERCFSAPANRYFHMSGQHHKKCKSKGEVTNGCKATGTKRRCTSAPKTLNNSRNAFLICNTLTQPNNTNQQTVHQNSVEKFSSSVLSKSNNFDQESMSDVISFCDELIEQQLDAYSTSDDSSVLEIKWRPQSCISFRRKFLPQDTILSKDKHHCSTFLKNRPHSSPNPRQRVKPKLTDPNSFRRGNVPKYISFVEPMPVHQRPGTGKSSGYESGGISVVSEDLLVSAGTHEELVDSGEESELDMGYNLLPCGDLEPKQVDVDDASQEAMMSSRSSFNRSELDGSLLDEEWSSMDRESKEDNMFSREDQDRLSSTDLQENGDNISNAFNGDLEEKDSLFNESPQSDQNTKNLDEEDFDDDRLSESLGTNVGVDGENSGLDNSGTMGYEDTERDSNFLSDYDQQNLDDTEKALDPNTSSTEIPTDQLDSAENNLQVTFSEPLTTDRPVSTNDSEDGTKSEPPRSILKGTVNDKNKIFERELDPTIMKRMTSSEGDEKAPIKPTMARRSADLRPQSKPDVLLPDLSSQTPSEDRQPMNQETEVASSDESDSDLNTSTGSRRRRKPKPKNSIYGKRANMKPPREKLRKRKESNNSDTEEVIMSAESALLMEQILEEEKRLREGMKPWLKGRLALSQQNSRFEIPMDVRMLETMTPMAYLTKYCIISKRRKALYQHVFQKVDRNRDGIINFAELEKGLTDVHTGILDSEHVENIVEMVLIDKEDQFDLKQFSAIAAFSERLSCKDQLPVEMLNNFDGQKEVIECADFFALSWKLDGIKVNPDVKKILDSL